MGITLGPDLGISPITRYYLSNDTWTKPQTNKFYAALVGCVAGGGGGASGNRGATGAERRGGGGGCGGCIVWRWIPAQNLSSSISITVGAGGTSGSAITSDNTLGNVGGRGGTTSFGSWVSAFGGGKGNQSGGSDNSPVTSCIPNVIPYAAAGAEGGTTNNSGIGFSTDDGLYGELFISNTGRGCPGGSAGGTINSSNVSWGAENGGGVYDRGTFVDGSTQGNAGGNNVALYWMFDANTPLLYGIGTGGAGGNAGGQNGGNGGNYGAGGGGGGGSTNGTNSGAGGKGGDGLCVVIEMYSY